MAETKTKKRAASKSASSSTKSKAKSQKPKSQSKAKSKSAKPKTRAKTAKPESSRSNGSSNGPSNGSSPVEAVRHTVGDIASKAKVPLVAGGAAIAGAAGGMALAAASKQGRKKGMKSLKAAMPRKPKVKINSGDLAKAAKEVGNFSTQMGELAGELQRARESADKNGKSHRSPVEVVLQGLTARR